MIVRSMKMKAWMVPTKKTSNAFQATTNSVEIGNVQGEEGQPVRDQDVEADRCRQREDEGSALADLFADEAARVAEQELHHDLELSGLPRVEAAGDQERQRHRHQDGQTAGDECVGR